LAGVGGRGVVSTLVLDAAAERHVQASGDVTSEDRTVSERFGERRPAIALVQRGAQSPTWTIAVA
jgi:hypothetical protein